MRGDYKTGRGMAVEPPNAKSWKEMAEEAAAALMEANERLEDAESRLAEIATIAAPDQEERLDRIEAMLERILARLPQDDGKPDPVEQV